MNYPLSLSRSLNPRLFCALVFGATICSSLAVRPTTIDPTFHADQSVDPWAGAPFVLPDGKVLVGAARLLPDGTLDTAFRLSDPTLPASFDRVTTTILAVASDRSLLAMESQASGNASPLPRIVRFNSDGSIEPTFSPATLQSSNNFYQVRLEIVAQGQLLVTGNFNDVNNVSREGVALLNPDGSLDPRFAVQRLSGSARAAALTSDGKLLIGLALYESTQKPASILLRVNFDGSIDRTFIPQVSDLSEVHALRVLPNDKILVAGPATNIPTGSTAPTVLIRLLSDGTIDPAFIAARETSGLDIDSIRLDNDRIFIGGYSNGWAYNYYRVLSLNTDGSLLQILTEGLERAGGHAMYLTVTSDNKLVGSVWLSSFAPLSPTMPIFGRFLTDYSIPGVEFDKAQYRAAESSSSAVVTVVRTGESSRPLSVQFRATQSVDSPSASGGLDFTPRIIRLDFAPGELFKAVTVPILDDPFVEGEKRVTLNLTDPSGGILGGIADATLIIQDNETPGSSSDTNQQGLRFSAPIVDFDENSSAAQITLLRTGPAIGSFSVDYTTEDKTALAGRDYGAQSGTIQFGPLETEKNISIPLYDNSLVDSNKDFLVSLSHIPNTLHLENGPSVTVRLHDDDRPGSLQVRFDPKPNLHETTKGLARFAVQSDGKILVAGVFNPDDSEETTSIERFNEDGSLDETFQVIIPANFAWGSWASVAALLPQSNNKILLGGDFRHVNGLQRPGVARLNQNGTVDETFDAGQVRDLVNALALQSDGKVLIGGSVSFIDTKPQFGVARLLPNGAFDPNFHSPFTNGTYVGCLHLQADGNLLVGGYLSIMSGREIEQRGLVRLKSDGGLDSSFSNTGLFGTIYQIIEQSDGKFVILADVLLTRLNPNGSVDNSFHSNLSFDYGRIALQQDGRILLAAISHNQDGSETRILRLNTDGSQDPSFQPAESSGSWRATDIFVLPGGDALIAGDFETFADIPRAGLVRLHGDPPLHLASISPKRNGATVTLNTLPDRHYILESSYDLHSWVPLSTNTASSFTLDFHDSSVLADNRRFYRARLK